MKDYIIHYTNGSQFVINTVDTKYVIFLIHHDPPIIAAMINMDNIAGWEECIVRYTWPRLIIPR